MSFRFDKYFAGQTGGGRFAGRPEAATLNVFLRQAVDAYEFLRRQADADPNRMLLVGHSEGGMYALVMAQYVTPKPAGIALLEPQDERILSLIGLQFNEHIDAFVARGLLSRSAAITNSELVRQAIADYRANRPVSTAGMAPIVIELIKPILLDPKKGPYTRTDDQIVPAEWAAKLPSSTQVLVTDGTRDPNVPPSTIGPLLRALQAADVGGPGFVRLQGADHFMHLPSQPDSQPVLAPAAIAAIQRWARSFGQAS
jgi:acetyl esterase/lipase